MAKLFTAQKERNLLDQLTFLEITKAIEDFADGWRCGIPLPLRTLTTFAI
jgi:hypothetical protein